MSVQRPTCENHSGEEGRLQGGSPHCKSQDTLLLYNSRKAKLGCPFFLESRAEKEVPTCWHPLWVLHVTHIWCKSECGI